LSLTPHTFHPRRCCCCCLQLDTVPLCEQPWSGSLLSGTACDKLRCRILIRLSLSRLLFFFGRRIWRPFPYNSSYSCALMIPYLLVSTNLHIQHPRFPLPRFQRPHTKLRTITAYKSNSRTIQPTQTNHENSHLLTAAIAPVPMEKPIAALANMEGLRGSLTTRPTNNRLKVMIASMNIAIASVTPGPGRIADIFVSAGVSLEQRTTHSKHRAEQDNLAKLFC